METNVDRVITPADEPHLVARAHARLKQRSGSGS